MPPKPFNKKFHWKKRKRTPAVSTPLASSRDPSESIQDDNEAEDDDDSSVRNKKVRWEGGANTTADGETAHAESEELGTGDDETEVTAPERRCMVVVCIHNRVAMAYYDPLKCKMYVMEDTMDTVHYDLSKMVFEQSSPDLVLTTSKADDQFIETMRDLVDGSGGVFQIRAYKDFNPGKGRDRLASLQLLADLPPETYESTNSTGSSSPSSGGHLRNASAYMSSRRQEAGGDPTLKRWTAAIRLSNYTSMDAAPLCLSAVGALLDHLVRERAVNDLENEGIRGLDIREIEMLALDKVMHINADALSSLQIFENESHACAQSDKTKEGLSLFGILNTTKTTLGKALLQTWLLRPSLSLEVIHSRHDAVACFVRPDNSTAVASLHGHLKGIKNVPRMLGILKDGRGKLSDWQGLVKFAFHCAMLKDALSELNQAGDIDIVKRMSGVLDIATLREVGNRINETIDWEESSQAGRVCVRAHVDEELDNRKTVYYGIDSVLSNVAQKLSTVVPPDYASSLNIVYFPQLGFLICVPMLEEWQGEAGISVIDGWTFQFSSESHVYFKSKEMNDMDIHIGDLHSVIVDREIEIVQALLEEILVHYDGMAEACDVCAELDCLLAFADAARLYDYRRPRMVEDNIIQITQGRHPLQEQVVDTFVPNDARLAGSGCDLSEIFDVDFSEPTGWNNVVLCTGANACGKSVFLKQIALIQFMAQIGCFVPADSATLGIVDKIFTRISTRESVSKAQSAFMIDLNQVSLALRNSTPRSLILLDEFGKGTLSTDGAGLLCGVLKHLLDRGADCPKVLAATHFHDVFREELLDPDTTPITFLHMQVMFTAMDGAILESDFSDAGSGSTRAVKPNEKITYLYRVAEGLSLMSHAAKCAEIFGVPIATVQRAQYVSDMISNHEIGALLDEDMDDAERQDLVDAEAVCRRFISWDFENEDDRVKERLAAVLGKQSGEQEEDQDVEMADGNPA